MRILDNYLFFYGSIYSQWHPAKFVDPKLKGTGDVIGRSLEFNCAEQYMMFHKALLFNDMNSLLTIMNTTNPGRQKQLGRKVKNFSHEEWDKVKFDVVTRGNYLKFTQNPQLKEQLEHTAYTNTILVEASAVDPVWGIGLDEHADRELLVNEANWRGENLLGKAIMEARDMIFPDIKKKQYIINPKSNYFCERIKTDNNE